MNIFVLALLGYLLYRFIGGFLIPLFRTSRQMHRHFQDAQNRSNNNFSQSNNPTGPAQGTPNNSSAGQEHSKVGEYIDFEEVKE